MYLLLIEDEEDECESYVEYLSTCDPPVIVRTARSRDSAFVALEEEIYDVAVCDLNIPTSDNALDSNTSHGIAVLNFALEKYPGMSIIILSAYGTLDITQAFISQAQKKDLFGAMKEIPMLEFCQKRHLDKFYDKVETHNNQLESLNKIVIIGNDSYGENKLLRIYSNRVNGTRIITKELSGGLSSNHTLIADIFNKKNVNVARTVGKFGKLEEVRDEKERIQKFVTPRLEQGKYAPVIDLVDAGWGDKGLVLYRRAEGYDRSLFEILFRDQEEAAKIVHKISEITKPWHEVSVEDSKRIKVMREWFLSNDTWISKNNISADWNIYEDREIKYHIGCQHGDLHLGNVLINSNGDPLLIDFGRTSDTGSTVIDPITLELSTIFHPQGLGKDGIWPSIEEAENWTDLDVFLQNCPIPDFIKACRNWTNSVCTASDEILSVVYSYAVRQLKYPTTNHQIACSIANPIISSFS